MRVVTWNIEHGLAIDAAIDALTTNPNLANADLVLLQEMDDEGPAQIAEALGLSHQYRAGCTHTGTGRSFGNAILARGTVGDPTVIQLPHLARVLGQRRIAVQAPVTLDLDDGPVDITAWSVHAEVSTLPHRRQVAQYREVADSVVGSAGPAVVAGDFNTASGRSVRGLVDNMMRAGLERANALSGRTFTRFGRGFELDHIFVKGLAVVDAGVVNDHAASDHDPVWAVLSPGEATT